MGFFSTILGFCGFGVGISIGLVAGYFFFIYFQPSDVQDPVIRPLVEQDSETLQRMFPEIPLWVKNPDYDRVDWINKFLEYMWPYLNKAICMTARNIAKPIIADQVPKYKIESVEFEAFTLGSLPPTFQGMKVYVTDEELIMEPSIKWTTNPNITVAVKAFGLKATVQVIGLFYSVRKILLYERKGGSEGADSKYCSVGMISCGGFASVCCTTYHLEAIGSNLSLFCQNLCVSHGQGIWHRRNRAVFEDRFDGPGLVIKKAAMMLEGFQEAEGILSGQKQIAGTSRANTKWLEALEQVTEINFDASVDKVGKKMGMGEVARNHEGELMFSICAAR